MKLAVVLLLVCVTYCYGDCRIPFEFVGDWLIEDKISKGFSIHPGHLVIYEDNGMRFTKVTCTENKGDKYLFKVKEADSPVIGFDAYNCFEIQMFKGDLTIKMTTNTNDAESGMYVVPKDDAVDFNLVCDGPLSEVHFLTRATYSSGVLGIHRQ
ncbi:uncharacterized protein LOC141908944 [Tubulanus polymorphus]|uniref:uncharacterized protein LOC141908944 n=1 Tax=Tubulanus polymorphus TaxID=672921 RepID=UPI003DA5B347